MSGLKYNRINDFMLLRTNLIRMVGRDDVKRLICRELFPLTVHTLNWRVGSTNAREMTPFYANDTIIASLAGFC